MTTLSDDRILDVSDWSDFSTTSFLLGARGGSAGASVLRSDDGFTRVYRSSSFPASSRRGEAGMVVRGLG